MDIADIMGDNEVLLYWVSPVEQDDAVTVVFWSVSVLVDISSCVFQACILYHPFVLTFFVVVV